MASALSSDPHGVMTRARYVVVDDGVTVIDDPVAPLMSAPPAYYS